MRLNSLTRSERGICLKAFTQIEAIDAQAVSSQAVMEHLHLAVFVTFLPAGLGMECTAGTGAVFFTYENENVFDRGAQCFNHCSSSNCTGVLLTNDVCVSLHTADFYGALDERNLFKKNCIAGAAQGSVVSVYRDKFLDNGSEKLLHADDERHCLSLCYTNQEIACQSIIYFADSHDCLLNTATSSKAAILKNEEDFQLVYMEKENRTARNNCSGAFHLIPWNKATLRGEAQLVNVSEGFGKCLSLCPLCDYVFYSEYFAECFLLTYESGGQIFDFVDEHFQVFENLCRTPTPSCSSTDAMYISHNVESVSVRNECLHRCVENPSCYKMNWNNGSCVMDGDGSDNLPTVIEKVCLEEDDQEIAVLFEETDACPKSDVGLEVGKADLNDCMHLCLTHPTKSCEAINYFPNGVCRLLEGPITLVKKGKKQNNMCRHFELKVITFDKIKPEKKKKKKSKKLQKPAKAHAASKMKQVKIVKQPIDTGAFEMKLETVCNYDSIIIKVLSPVPIYGHVFPRNAHSKCSTMMNGTEALLRMPLNNSECLLSKDKMVYWNVIVVKHNDMTDVPVITEYDKLYRISCDYSNHTKKILQSTSVLQVVNPTSSANLRPTGTIKYIPLKMKLKSKSASEMKPVVIGQNVDLQIDDERFGSNYTLEHCYAHDWKGHENISLIENGCATLSAREYIIRGAITRNHKGFSIPMRAFRFRNGEAVKIVCRVKMCEECEQKSCATVSRKRRHMRELGSDPDSDELQISLLVHDEPLPPNSYCVTRAGLISISSIGSLTLFVQFLFLLKMLHDHRKRSV
ncbi:hypothetical protein Q1695_003674 [Nippostrongylus brasiliensis]|nr:hypothetical protein Q1695_003674 [Nippostrongylus brasiliensis]